MLGWQEGDYVEENKSESGNLTSESVVKIILRKAKLKVKVEARYHQEESESDSHLNKCNDECEATDGRAVLGQLK